MMLIIFFEQPPPLDPISIVCVSAILLELFVEHTLAVMSVVQSRGPKLINCLLAHSAHEKVLAVLRSFISTRDQTILESCARVKIFQSRATRFQQLTAMVAALPGDNESIEELTSIGRFMAMCGSDLSLYAGDPAAPACVTGVSLYLNPKPLMTMLECSLDCFISRRVPQPLIVTFKVINALLSASALMVEAAQVHALEAMFSEVSRLFGRIEEALARGKDHCEIQILVLSFFSLSFRCNTAGTNRALYTSNVPLSLINFLDEQKTKISNLVTRGVSNCVQSAFYSGRFSEAMVKAWFEETPLPSIFMQCERYIVETPRSQTDESPGGLPTRSYTLVVRSLAASLHNSRVFETKAFSATTPHGTAAAGAAAARTKLSAVCARAAALDAKEVSSKLVFNARAVDTTRKDKRSYSPPRKSVVVAEEKEEDRAEAGAER